MRFRADADSTPGSSPIRDLASKITETSAAANQDQLRAGGNDLMATILAEFLVGADLAPTSWWRPSRDPEPEPEIARVYDGSLHYERVASGWQRLEGDHPVYTWQDIPAPLLVDSTRVQPGSWRLNNPAPGGPVADWHATTPDNVAEMIRAALDMLAARGPDAEVVATMWTPRAGMPIIMVRFGEPGEDEQVVTPGDAEPGE